MTFRKRELTGNLNRKHQIAMCVEMALEGAANLTVRQTTE